MFTSILSTLLVAAVGWGLTEAVYRLFLHPLAHIPGPRLAALTWWYDFYYDVVCKGRYTFKIKELHAQYGPIIRITPDEVHIHDVGFTDRIYAPATSVRDKYSYLTRRMGLPKSIGPCIKHEVHKIRRGALAPYFSKRNIRHLQPILSAKVQQLCGKLDQHAESGQVANLSDLFFAFSNDIVNNFLFAHEVDVLSDQSRGSLIRKHSTQFLFGVHVRRHFPWIRSLLQSLPTFIAKHAMPPAVKDMIALQQRIQNEVRTVMENHATKQNSAGQSHKESVFASILSDDSLPPQEKDFDRLTQEGIVLTLAGTEAPAKSLGILMVNLLSNKALLERLHREIADIPYDAPSSQLDGLPYLSALIEEANRLSFGVTSRSARVAREPIVYQPTPHAVGPIDASKTFMIPAHTPVSVSSLSANTAESVFPEPFKFDPERWLGDQGRQRLKYQFSFSQGSRKCLGIDLARAEIGLAIVTLVKRFDFELFETDLNDVAFVHDFQIAHPRVGSQGVRVTAKRREA